jgi:hypothetical protein
MVVGNVNEEPFEDIWAGEASRRAVEQIVEGRFAKCTGCWLRGDRHAAETEDGLFLI